MTTQSSAQPCSHHHIAMTNPFVICAQECYERRFWCLVEAAHRQNWRLVATTNDRSNDTLKTCLGYAFRAWLLLAMRANTLHLTGAFAVWQTDHQMWCNAEHAEAEQQYYESEHAEAEQHYYEY